MPRHKILITVATYPLPSRSYDELVCTAGILENGQWIRIYPVPLKFLMGLRAEGKMESFKYNWIELDLNRRRDDFRPESYSPANYNFSDLKTYGKIDTRNNWQERKKYCLSKVYTNLSELINDSKEPGNVSLATFKPTKFLEFKIKNDEREWKTEWTEIRKQGNLFQDINSHSELDIPKKLPFKFYYRFEDDSGKESSMMIEDWEIGALYWNCLKRADGDEEIALKKVKEKYKNEFWSKMDIHLFLGTTMEWHRRRSLNPFVIIGVFYPNKISQTHLDF